MSYKGIDVSHYNQPIDWKKVKGQVDFAILKLGNIGDSKKFWLDETFENNYNACKSLGIPVGVYVYSYINNVDNAKIAGQEVANYVKNLNLELPVYIDMEDKELKPEGKEKLTQTVINFNTEIEKIGKWAGVYFNLDWINNYLNKDEIKKRYTTWIAHPENADNQDKYKGQYDMFQYSWKGHIDGCNGNDGNVDMNIMYRDLIGKIKGSHSEPQLPAKKSIDEIANEVINGLWGNGEDRKKRLTEAGYDYQTIQNRVNEILKPKEEYYPTCKQNETSLVDGLKYIGVDSSMANRKRIANRNGINNYSGTSAQNNQLLTKLKAGRLLK